MFGNSSDNVSQSVKAGINTGKKITSFFTSTGGIDKNGNPWKAFIVMFGDYPREMIFVPRIRETPSQYDADGLVKTNERLSLKGKPAAKLI